MAIALADLLDEKHVVLQLHARKQANALREIVQLLAANGKIDHPEKFLDAVLAREQANPSAVEHGVAFPHARTDLVDRIVLGIGRSRVGVPFCKGQRARLIFVIGVPQRLINDYLICVGTLARLVKDDVTRAALLDAKTPRQFLHALTPGE
jgi:mannitol/fructose-specific phosphotransferase system IIA component (Ntr-type)